ncbi:MAG: hypothetical protein Q9225_005365 [Loekoesia sp. 1 TL-2023]
MEQVSETNYPVLSGAKKLLFEEPTLQNCLDANPSLRLDSQYLEFGQDIKALADTLQCLPRIIQNAESQSPQRPWNKPEDDYRAAQVVQAAGDFNGTLKECQTLLDNNTRFRTDANRFVRNVQWSLGVERDVGILRDRVRFHLVKLGILLKPFEIQLLSEIRQELHHLRQDVAEIKGLLTARDGFVPAASTHDPLEGSTRGGFSGQIPEAVAHRFEQALSDCPPASYIGTLNLPLQAATDALVYHFSRSTIEYNPGLDLNQRVPKVPQYLNLLKSQWILEKLENSSEVKSQASYSLWNGYLQELRINISKEFERFDSQKLEAPSEDVVLLLDDRSYSIWRTETPAIGPAPLAEQGPAEETILELELPDSSATRQSSLTVHRRSFIEFRLVTTIVDKHNKDFRHEKEIVVNTDASAIVPVYALPSQESPSPSNILISNHHVRDLNWQTLKTSGDVDLLQQALLGYRVFHSMSDIRWSINGSNKPGETGQARMQLWQHKTLRDLSQGENGLRLHQLASSASESQLQSPVHEAEQAQGQRRMTTLSGSTIISGPSMTSKVTGPRGQATVLLPPNPSVLVLFITHEGKHAFLHVELTRDVVVDQNKCNCRSEREPCSTTVIRNVHKGLKIRRYCARESSDQGLATWDLAVFRHPQHPKFNGVEILAKVKYLRLDFLSAALNSEFQAELSALEKIRGLDLKLYNKALVERRNRDGKVS